MMICVDNIYKNAYFKHDLTLGLKKEITYKMIGEIVKNFLDDVNCTP